MIEICRICMRDMEKEGTLETVKYKENDIVLPVNFK
jgi:hypothetical protein